MKRAKIDDQALKRVLPTDYIDRVETAVPVAKSKARRQIYYLTEDLVRRVKLLAERRAISSSDVVKLALDDYLSEHGV